MACYDAKYGIGRFGISRYGTLCAGGGLIYNNTAGIFKKKIDLFDDIGGMFRKKTDAFSNASGNYKKKLRP